MTWYDPRTWSSNPQPRAAEGVVQAKSQQVNPGTTNQPTSAQQKDPFESLKLTFPPNLGEAKNRLHWIKFTPCIQQKSSYKVTEGSPSNTDINRAGSVGSGAINPYGNALGTGTEIATILGTINGGTAAASAIKNILETQGNRNQLNAAISGGLNVASAEAGAILAGGIVASIHLSRKTRRAAGYISLYMPDNINLQLVNDYDQVSLTQALGKAGLAAQAGDSIAGQITDKLGGSSMIRTGQGGGGIAEVAGVLADKTGNLGAGIGDVLLFSAGLAQNPQVELLFKSIQNREFQFDFKFVPKSPQEAQTILDIIKAFRFHAAPEIAKNGKGRYFVPPSEFDIDFMLGQEANRKLPRISTCILQGVDANYGSAGQWTAFEDGMPVEITLQLRFKEVEIMHKDLINQGY